MPEMGAQQLQITNHGLGLLYYKAKLKWRDLLHQCVASDTVINLSSRHSSGGTQSNHSSVSVLINGFFDCREDGLIHTREAGKGRSNRFCLRGDASICVCRSLFHSSYLYPRRPNADPRRPPRRPS